MLMRGIGLYKFIKFGKNSDFLKHFLQPNDARLVKNKPPQSSFERQQSK